MSPIFRLLAGSLLLPLLLAAAPALAGGIGYYPNGQVQWEYLYQDGQLRETKWYDDQGRLNARSIFRDGRQTMSEGYRGDGSLEWQGRELADGRQEITRFAPGRRAEMRYELAGGQADGVSTLFSPGGQPRQSVTFRNGLPHGPAHTWYENGQVESAYAYRDGQLDGVYRSFSPEGQPTVEYTFEKGQLR
jgi:antitoxin component YwqK of YwqJK toxin-antitoxin module